MIKAKKTAAQAARNFILQVTVKIEELCLVTGGHWRSLEVPGLLPGLCFFLLLPRMRGFQRLSLVCFLGIWLDARERRLAATGSC